jgi:hypothetical protein
MKPELRIEAIAGEALFKQYEGNSIMEWISENWIWVALIGGMGAMHLFGHRKGGGCCGGGQKSAEVDRSKDPTKTSS